MKVITLALIVGASLAAQNKPLIADYVAANVGAPPDAALLVARDIVIHMLARRTDLREYMAGNGYRIGVMSQSEMTTDIPEHRNLKKPQLTDPRVTEGERKNYDHRRHDR